MGKRRIKPSKGEQRKWTADSQALLRSSGTGGNDGKARRETNLKGNGERCNVEEMRGERGEEDKCGVKSGKKARPPPVVVPVNSFCGFVLQLRSAHEPSGFIPFLGSPHSNPDRATHLGNNLGCPAQHFLSQKPIRSSHHPLPIRKSPFLPAYKFRAEHAVPPPAPIPAVRRSSGVCLSALGFLEGSYGSRTMSLLSIQIKIKHTPGLGLVRDCQIR